VRREVTNGPSGTRRRLIGTAAIALAQLTGVRLAMAELLATPAQMEGPFYPLTLPLDRDNDLVTVAGRSGRAKGAILDVGGRILDTSGRPVAGVRIEIWQVNGFGRYHHPGDERDLPIDPNFQGFGETVSDATGGYRFRTVKPVAYPGRAPHIHFALTGAGFGPFYTQMYVAGAPENAQDFLLRRVTDRKARESLIVTLEPSPDPGSELAGRFDVVLGSALLSRTKS
jgi:protocatechuate 3,4-dioxygenase, beta subunit